MKKLIKKNLCLAALLAILILPSVIFIGNIPAKAQDQTPAANAPVPNPIIKNMQTVGEGSGFEKADTTSAASIAGQVVAISLGFLGIIFVCLIIYAGFLWMTAAGDESKVSKAQTIIKNSIIGLIVLTSAWAIYNIVNRLF